MSTRISASLGLDTQGFSAGITKAEADANRFSARLRAQGVGMFSGKSARDSANSIGAILAAEEKLAATRKANAFSRMADTQKITALEAEISAAKAKSAAIDGVTLEKVQIELGIEEKLLQVERLRASVGAVIAREQAAAAAATQAAAVAATQAAAAEQRQAAATAARIAQLNTLSLQRRTAREAAALQGGSVALLGAGGNPAAPASGAAKGGALASVGGMLGRTFGLPNLAKGLLAGAGIGTALQLIDSLWGKITAKMDAAEELGKKIAEYNERTRTALQASAEFGRSDRARLAGLKGEESVLQRQLAMAQQPPGVRVETFGQMLKRNIGLGAPEDTASDPREIEAQLAENRAKQKPLEAALLEKNKARLIETLAVQKQIGEERAARARSQMSLEEQLEESKSRQLRYDRLAIAAKDGTLVKAQYSLEAEKAITEQVRLRAELDAKAQEAWDRALSEETKRQEEVATLTEREATAAERVQKARDSLQQQKKDALGFTVQELATTPSGRPNNTAAGMAARRIQQDEATSRSLARTGNKISLFDAKTQRPFEASAEFFQNRALNSRAGMKGLTSSEQNPFAAASAELKQAGADLKQAAADLKNIEVEVDAS